MSQNLYKKKHDQNPLTQVTKETENNHMGETTRRAKLTLLQNHSLKCQQKVKQLADQALIPHKQTA